MTSLPDDRSSTPAQHPGSRRRAALLAAVGVVVVVATVALIAWEPWHGPIVLSFSSTHGVDAGDVVALPLIACATLALQSWFVGRRRAAPGAASAARRRAGPVAAILLGGLLLSVSVAVLVRTGTLISAGGGTFDGSVSFVAADESNPVGRWSYVAVTYDGGEVRLYVNGERVAQAHVSGTIQDTPDPLWIGGNSPYGEHFTGLIDEVRVYDRALDPEQIAGDMDEPVEPMSGSGVTAGNAVDPTLVAAYGFDAGTGTEAFDSSGRGNTGTIDGATWTPAGRFGAALAFHGDEVVRVPPSPSLRLGSAMTISAWIEPTVSQRGWRTIVQRQTDAYFLTAGSVPNVSGPLVSGNPAVLLIMLATAWFAVELLVNAGSWLGARRRWWPVAIGLVLAGCALDVLFTPDGTMFAALLLALWFAVTARSTTERLVGWLTTAVLALGSIMALTDLGGAADRLGTHEGSIVRTVALGGLLVIVGLLRLLAGRADRSGVDPIVESSNPDF